MAEAQPLAVVGVSVRDSCGVRDHAALLGDALAAQGVPCRTHWLDASVRSRAGSGAEMLTWTRDLRRELRRELPRAVLLHYSVFSLSYRGLPLFVPPTIAALRHAGTPLVSVLHEIAYPWRVGGVRGTTWALTQRLALIELMRASAAALVTTEFRADWLASRRWLASRPLAFAPVFSNLPPTGARPPAGRARPAIGLFGYAYEGASRAIVLDALSLLRERGVEVELVLLGAPGAASASAREWREQARVRGLQGQLSFSGWLPAQELADALGSCEVLLFADVIGPTSRKGTLAGALASGRPVVALDGRRRWQELLDSRALLLADPAPEALAGSLARLLDDEAEREALGGRGRAFAQSSMSVARTAREVVRLLAEVTGSAGQRRAR